MKDGFLEKVRHTVWSILGHEKAKVSLLEVSDESEVTLHQGDVVWIDLGEKTEGFEIRGVRPCLIVQSNYLNRKCKMFLVAPIKSNIDRVEYMTNKHIYNNRDYGLTRPSCICFNQMRTVSIDRMKNKNIYSEGTVDVVGHIPQEVYMRELLNTFGVANNELTIVC